MTTTLKLTDAQVQALFYAMERAARSHEDYDEFERKEFGHAAWERSFEQIQAKLEKQGWS